MCAFQKTEFNFQVELTHPWWEVLEFQNYIGKFQLKNRKQVKNTKEI